MDVQIRAAINVLKEGGVILYPTDTIWGLGCDATDAEAVAKIFKIKRRAESKSLVTLVNNMDMIGLYVKEIPQAAIDLIDVNDAPMTIIYPGARVAAGSSTTSYSSATNHTAAPSNSNATSGSTSRGSRYGLAKNVVAEDGTVGIRIPNNEFCKQLIFRLHRPLVSTSANISGEPSPKGIKDISQEIKDAVDYIVSPSMEENSTHKASQIIKVELDGRVTVIRG